LSAATLFNRYLSGRMYFGLSLRLMQYAMKCFPPQVLAHLPFLSFAYDCFRPLVDSSFSSGCQAAPELGKKDGCTQEFTRFDKTGLTRLKDRFRPVNNSRVLGVSKRS